MSQFLSLRLHDLTKLMQSVVSPTTGSVCSHLSNVPLPFSASALYLDLFSSLISPPENDQHINDKEKKRKSFLAPLKIFVPTRNITVGNKTKHDYNLLFLACGAFFSVLATGYVHMGLQLVGTDKFGFQPGESGILR